MGTSSPTDRGPALRSGPCAKRIELFGNRAELGSRAPPRCAMRSLLGDIEMTFSAAAFAMVLLCIGYTLVLLVLSRRQPRRDARLPRSFEPSDMVVAFVIPALNEGRVIAASIDRLLRLDTDVRTLVLVVDDGSDDDTAQIVRAYGDPRVHLLRRTAPDCRQGKGEALNAAYRHLLASRLLRDISPDHVVLAVLDADGRLDVDALKEVLPFFSDSKVGGVQIGVRINNRTAGWLARMQDIEFVVFGDIFQRARRHYGDVGMGGNGQFMRLNALETLGRSPWSRSLTEDLDLGVRLVTSGWRTEFTHRVAVHQQGLLSLRRLLRQRTRWFQGHLQSWALLPTVVRDTRGMVRRDLLFHLTAPFLVLLGSLLTVSFVLGFSARVLGAIAGTTHVLGWWILPVYLLSFCPGALYGGIYWRYERGEGLGLLRSLLLGHTFVVYALLWCVVGWRATLRELIAKTTWAKTARELEPSVVAAPVDASLTPVVFLPHAGDAAAPAVGPLSEKG